MWGRFEPCCQPHTLFSDQGSLGPKTMIWLYLGLLGSKYKLRGHFPRVQLPIFTAFHPLVLVLVWCTFSACSASAGLHVTKHARRSFEKRPEALVL